MRFLQKGKALLRPTQKERSLNTDWSGDCMGQSTNEWIWDAYQASPADFAGVDNIITNLVKERDHGIEIIERTPLSLVITSLLLLIFSNKNNSNIDSKKSMCF